MNTRGGTKASFRPPLSDFLIATLHSGEKSKEVIKDVGPVCVCVCLQYDSLVDSRTLVYSRTCHHMSLHGVLSWQDEPFTLWPFITMNCLLRFLINSVMDVSSVGFPIQ